jgi:hypothetical protein
MEAWLNIVTIRPSDLRREISPLDNPSMSIILVPINTHALQSIIRSAHNRAKKARPLSSKFPRSARCPRWRVLVGTHARVYLITVATREIATSCRQTASPDQLTWCRLQKQKKCPVSIIGGCRAAQFRPAHDNAAGSRAYLPFPNSAALFHDHFKNWKFIKHRCWHFIGFSRKREHEADAVITIASFSHLYRSFSTKKYLKLKIIRCGSRWSVVSF